MQNKTQTTKFEEKLLKIFPNTDIITLEEFKKYPHFCPLDENGEMYPDPEHDINILYKIYILNDFEPDEDEMDLLKESCIQLFSVDGAQITSMRIMGYGSESYREKLDELLYNEEIYD
ncbi:MAG: hypothetical protein ACOX56_04720 [Acholeplasmataceae bacterium]|jgi:hypothetical protein